MRPLVHAARIPRVTGIAVSAIGLGALVGWQLDVAWLKSLAPGHALMNPATALGLVLVGVALRLSPAPGARSAGPSAWVARGCAAAVVLLGLVRLSGYLLRFDPGIDHLIFAGRVAAGPPNRMSPQDALTFLLVGVALALQGRHTKRAQLAVQLLAWTSAAIALVGVTGHAYGTRSLYGAMALNTAVAFLIAAVGVLWARPDVGIAAVIASATPGGVLARRLLPAIIVIPLLLGWLRLVGERAGVYDTEGGTALFAGGTIAVLVALAWWSARSLDRADVERRRAVQALQATQAQLQHVLASSTVVIYANHVRGTSFSPSWVSENITRIMGYDVQAAMDPAWWLDHLHQDDRARVLAEIPALLAQDRLTIEYRFRHADGTYRSVRDESRLLRDAGGAPLEVFGAWMDITEERRAQEALHASEERFRLLVGNVRDYAIFMLDPAGRVASWNRGAQQIKGYREAEIVGQHFSRFYTPEDVAAGKPEAALRAAVAEGRYEEENWRVRKDGSRFWADVVITAVRDERRTLIGFAKVTRDLTERRRAEAELRARTAELEAANKELEAFSYSVSHDLRAPLRSIDGFSQALQEDYTARLDEEGRSHLRRVRAATKRMEQLIDDLLQLAQLGRAELRSEPVDLSALARSIFGELRQREPRRAIEFACVDQAPVRGDPRLLRIVLENLLNNAWKFTLRRQPARIEFGSVAQDGRPVYFVRDNGAGFNMAYAEKLFGPFQRLHGATEFPGSGIGLATVHRILQRHGGRVWAEAVVDGGATFYFTL